MSYIVQICDMKKHSWDMFYVILCLFNLNSTDSSNVDMPEEFVWEKLLTILKMCTLIIKLETSWWEIDGDFIQA